MLIHALSCAHVLHLLKTLTRTHRATPSTGAPPPPLDRAASISPPIAASLHTPLSSRRTIMADSGVVKRRKSQSGSADGSASSSSSSKAVAASAEVNKAGTGHWGFTEDGTRFDVPDTLNTMEIFLPHNLSIGSAISLTCVLISAYLVAFGGYSKWLHIGIFFFWRLSYDLGLGLILRGQSEHKTFMKFYLRHYGDGSSWKAKLLDHLAIRQLPSDVRARTPITSYPQVFRAWLVYKNLVNIILVNDGLTYLLLGLKCFHFPPTEGFTLWVMLQYFVGICLALFNWWAKVDAHRCIGEYW
jgi:phosphatidylethanolamine N-methyltransferase